MRTIAYKSTSVLLCLALSFGLLLGSLALPKRSHAVVPILGGALAAAGVSDVAAVGAFAALLAACGFSLANAVGANPDYPIGTWSDEQLERAKEILDNWLQRAHEAELQREMIQLFGNMPEPPEEPPDDDPDDDPPEVEGEKVQPKKTDTDNPFDYMLAMLAVNGGIGMSGAFGDVIPYLVDWATDPESEGGGGFMSADSVVYPTVQVGDGDNTATMVIGDTISPVSLPSGYSFLYRNTSSPFYNYASQDDAVTGISYITSGGVPVSVKFSYSNRSGYYWNESYNPSSWNATSLTTGNISLSNHVFSPYVARMIDPDYQPISLGGLLYEIAGQNAQMQQAMQQMQNDTSAAATTLQQIYANDLAQSQAGTPQYLTVQAPYYVQSGQTDPQTGEYTANIVANDYNQGVIAEYSNAVASNTSSPQPGNTGYSPGDYTGNSSSDIPPWQPLLDIHLDRVWPFSLIGDSYKTFDDVFSMDGGSEWDWHITIPLSSWNIALGGAAVFDDYDLDLSIWRELFAYLAPWFLLFVFLSLLDMARRLWLRWNSSGDGD